MIFPEAQFLLGGETFNWVLDVAHDGDDLAVLVGQWITSYFPQLPSAFQGNGIVLLSRDGGDAWERVELPQREAFYEPWWVHVGQEGLFVVLVEDRTSVGPIYQVREVNIETGAYDRTAEMPAGMIHFEANAIRRCASRGPAPRVPASTSAP